MTEMHEPDTDTARPDLPIADDLAAEAGDDTLQSVLGLARTAWFSTTETQPNDDLRAFMAGAAQSAPNGSPRAWRGWSTTVTDTLSNLWPPSGRVAFAASMAALVSVFAVASFALAGPDPEQRGTASSGSTSTSSTVSTTPTTSTSSAVSSMAVADQPSTRITVADAGSADVAVSNGVPVLLGADPAPGWRVVEEVPDEPNEIDLSYRRGDDRVDLDVEIDDGQIRVRIRDRRTDTRTESFLGSTTVTTDRRPDDSDDLDDDEYREDNSGPGNAEDRGDSSGPGSDDDEDREDESGSASGDDY